MTLAPRNSQLHLLQAESGPSSSAWVPAPCSDQELSLGSELGSLTSRLSHLLSIGTHFSSLPDAQCLEGCCSAGG